MEPLSTLVLGVWGEIKTAKTTLGLSFPKPLFHLDFDQGIDRALPRFLDCRVLRVPDNTPLSQVNMQGADIITKPYILPIKWPGQAIQGLIKLWESVMDDMRVACESSYIKSIIPDTGSGMWKMCTLAHLERLQLKDPNRQSIIQIEYGRPNGEMRAMFSAGRKYYKNMAILHHVGGMYEEKFVPDGKGGLKKESIRIGDTWDGFGGMGQFVDIVAKTHKGSTDGSAPPLSLTFETCGLTLAAEGMNIPTPSYDSILNLINGLRSSGL